MHTVVVAEGLQQAGLRVAVIQPGASFVRYAGVDYFSAQDVIQRGLYALDCDALVSQRFGALPPNVTFKRLAVEMHDLPDERVRTCIDFMQQVPDCKTILHSKFNADLYQDFPGKTIIPAAFEDSLFDMPRVPRVTDKRERTFVYGSAALKGLAPTLQLWGDLKRNKYEFKKATLIVTSPGYDRIEMEESARAARMAHPTRSPELSRWCRENAETLGEWGISLNEQEWSEGEKKLLLDDSRVDVLRDRLAGLGITFEQQQTLGDMQMRLANSDGIFMVNVLPETYGCVQAMAEIAGRPAWCLCINGRGAFDESLANADWSVHTDPNAFVDAISKPRWPATKPAHDVRMSTLLPLWLEALGYAEQKEADATGHAA